MRRFMKEDSLSGNIYKFTHSELRELEKNLYKFLQEHLIYPEDGTFYNSTNPLADLELMLIIEGDWKHEHLYTEQLIEEFCDNNDLIILKHTNTEIGNSFSDDYRSEHRWYICLKTEKIDKKMVSDIKKVFSEGRTNGVNEDTVKIADKKWVNKGDSGETHGNFRTKRQADAQRRAMFANGYKK